MKHFGEYETTPEHTKLYVILTKHKYIKMVSDGNHITEIGLI